MNQIAIFGVALLIAYSAGVPVDEQTLGNLVINGLQVQYVSENSSVNSLKSTLCFIDDAVFVTQDICEHSCKDGCKFPFCGGFKECEKLGAFTYQCHCKNPTQSSDEAVKALINNNEGKAPKDFLSALAKNEQNGEVAANH